MKLQQHRQAVLLKVRRRLAVIVIRTYWRDLRLNFKAMQIKIIKYKRKCKAYNNRKAAFSRYSALSPRGALDQSVGLADRFIPLIALSVSEVYSTEWDLSTKRRDSSVSELFKTDLTKLQDKGSTITLNRHETEEHLSIDERHQGARDQLYMKKVAHNIPLYSEKLPLPCLQERAIHSSGFSQSVIISPNSHVLSSTAASSARASKPERLKPSGPLFRSLLIQAPPTAPCRYRQGHVHTAAPLSMTAPKDVRRSVSHLMKSSVFKLNDGDEPSYMRATSASKRVRGHEEEPRKCKRKSLDLIDLKKLSLPTFSYEMKIKEPVSDTLENKKEPWKPSVSKNPQYTPALDNKFYNPSRLPRAHYSRRTASLPYVQ